jgi:hypothetical protein
VVVVVKEERGGGPRGMGVGVMDWR